MNFQKQLVLVTTFCLLFTTPVFGADLTIITPYWGTEDNTFDQYGLKLSDSQTTKGLFIQSINPETYQWNVFIYQTENINYSDLWGVNFIYDLYLGADPKTKNVIGIGMNYFEMDLEGEDSLNLDLTIFSPYLRIGKYYNFGKDKLHCTLLPWIGGQLDHSRVLVDPSPRAATFKIDDDQYFWIAGLNLKVNFSHYLQLEAKRSVAYSRDYFLDKSSAMVNLFLTRNVGLSYRYNYHETTAGEDSYNILGVAIVF